MHLAIVTPYFPDPQSTTSRLRIHKLARSLARHGPIQLFSALEYDDSVAESQRAGRSMEPYARVVTHRLQPANAGQSTSAPQACRAFPAALVRALGAAHEVHPFDVVVVASVLAAAAIDAVPRAPVVLDVPRIESLARERQLRRNAKWAPWRLFELYRWRRYEREAWMRVDALTAARVADLPILHVDRPDTGVHVSNGVDASLHAFRAPSQRSGNTVLFAGPLWYEPNVLSAMILAREVMPRVREKVGEANLTVAGRSPAHRVRSLESDNVHVVDTLTSLVPLFADHAVFAVPPPPGRCPETRLLDAFASGMPVVTSVEALPDPAAIANRHFIAAHGPSEMAKRIAEVLLNRQHFDAMAMQASRLAARYDWELVGDRFARVVLGAAEKRRG
jgi:polysaccharide biosynthesis protein PslH